MCLQRGQGLSMRQPVLLLTKNHWKWHLHISSCQLVDASVRLPQARHDQIWRLRCLEWSLPAPQQRLPIAQLLSPKRIQAFQGPCADMWWKTVQGLAHGPWDGAETSNLQCDVVKVWVFRCASPVGNTAHLVSNCGFEQLMMFVQGSGDGAILKDS